MYIDRWFESNEKVDLLKSELTAIDWLFNCNWIPNDGLQVAFWESSLECEDGNAMGETKCEAINMPLWIKRVRLETLISERPKQINTWYAHKVAYVSMRPLQCHTHNNKSMCGPWFPISQECVSHFTASGPVNGPISISGQFYRKNCLSTKTIPTRIPKGGEPLK